MGSTESGDWVPWLEGVEGAIREGRGAEARRRLQRLQAQRPPRPQALWGARLCRRAGLPLLGLAVLNPWVRPPRGAPSDASPQERAEYAASLTRLGASGEALNLLSSLDPKDEPEVDLFLAFALFTRWRYGDAIAPLERYCADPRLSPYAQRVGQVNLAACLVSERRHGDAARLLGDLREATQREGQGLLYGNALELSAQDAFFRRRYDEARAYLAEAAQRLQQSHNLDFFFVVKWTALVELFSGKKGIEVLAPVRAEAIERRHWETSRDCDRFAALHGASAEGIRRVYFGTPYPHFRKRLLLDATVPVPLEAPFSWVVGRPAPNGGPLDVRSPEGWKRGQLLHRLLLALSDDFYRPARVASLHDRLFPGEHFHPTGGPLRVHQALHRLRRQLRRERAGLEVEEMKGEYHLRGAPGRRLLVGTPEDRKGDPLEFLGAGPIRCEQVARALGVSSATAVRWLRGALERGEWVREGRGPACRYRRAVASVTPPKRGPIS